MVLGQALEPADCAGMHRLCLVFLPLEFAELQFELLTSKMFRMAAFNPTRCRSQRLAGLLSTIPLARDFRLAHAAVQEASAQRFCVSSAWFQIRLLLPFQLPRLVLRRMDFLTQLALQF